MNRGGTPGRDRRESDTHAQWMSSSPREGFVGAYRVACMRKTVSDEECRSSCDNAAAVVAAAAGIIAIDEDLGGGLVDGDGRSDREKRVHS